MTQEAEKFYVGRAEDDIDYQGWSVFNSLTDCCVVECESRLEAQNTAEYLNEEATA